MKGLLNIILFTTIIACGEVNKRDLLADDIRLFKNSPVWKLAKFVEEEDTSAMKELLIKDNSKIDYQESNFGKSLLNWAAYNSKVNAAKILLEFGADPNLPDTYDGRSAFIQSCGYSFFSGDGYDTSTELMELMLQYGGDVNAVEVGPRVDGHETRYTPLMMAASCCYEKVKILVEAGADINYVDEFNESVLRKVALGNKDNDKTMKYLLIEKGANPEKAFVLTNSGDTVKLPKLVENWNFEEGTEEFKNKQIILEYLKTKDSVK
jgi:ankyrin repeat protein